MWWNEGSCHFRSDSILKFTPTFKPKWDCNWSAVAWEVASLFLLSWVCRCQGIITSETQWQSHAIIWWARDISYKGRTPLSGCTLWNRVSTSQIPRQTLNPGHLWLLKQKFQKCSSAHCLTKFGLWIKNTVGDIGNSGDKQGSFGKIAFAGCIDQLLSVVTEDALLLVNTSNLGIIESKRMQVRSSELDQRNASWGIVKLVGKSKMFPSASGSNGQNPSGSEPSPSTLLHMQCLCLDPVSQDWRKPW